MQQWQKNLWVLWLGAFVSSMCFTLVTPFLPLFLKELRIEKGLETWAGLCGSASFFMNAVMSPVWGSLADRYGRKIMVLRSGLAQAITYSLQFFVTNPYQFLALRILNGTFSGTVPACTALAATNTPEANISYALGVLQTAPAVGSIMGPLFGGIAAQFLGYRLTFLGAGVMLFVVTVLMAIVVKETAPRRRDSKVEVLKDIAMAMKNPMLKTVFLTAVIVQASLSVLQPVLSLQIARLGGSGKASIAAGVIYSLAGVATIIAAPIWARIGKNIGFRFVLITGLVSAGLLHIPMAIVRSVYVFGALRFSAGLATAGANLSVNALAAKSVGSEFRGRAFGILASCNQFGQFLGPMAGGVAGTNLGLEATFIVAAGMLLVTSALAVRLLPREPGTATAVHG